MSQDTTRPPRKVVRIVDGKLVVEPTAQSPQPPVRVPPRPVPRPTPAPSSSVDRASSSESALEKQSRFLAESSTQLSTMLESLEAKLQSLPGRLAVEYPDAADQNREEYLSYERRGDTWMLILYTFEGGEDGWKGRLVSQLPVAAKARAAAFAPGLVSTLLSELRTKLKSVLAGISGLNEALKLLDKAEKEGA